MLAKKTRKKALSLLMALAMIAGLLPMQAFATYPNQVMNGYFELNQNGTVNNQNGAAQVVSDGFTRSKTIAQTGENNFNITLQVQTQQTVTTTDAAVLLVIDTSGSMKGEKLSSAKIAAQNFVDQLILGNANGGKIYVAVVQFAENANKVIGWTDITDTTSRDNVKSKIGALTADGGTNLDGGLMLARNLLKVTNASIGGKTVDISALSGKYTVLLTDGKPTYRTTSDSTSIESIAKGDGNGNDTSEQDRVRPVARATEIKSLGSKLYTVCYGVGNDELYSYDIDKCVNCGKTKAEHTGLLDWCYFGTSIKRYQATTVTVTMGQYLANEIATPRSGANIYAFNATDSASLYAAFRNIAASTVSGVNGQGTRIVDPMGEFITANAILTPGENAVIAAGGKSLTWTLDPATAAKAVVGSVTTYTYTLQYTITLDPTAPGFAENHDYPTNGYTYLELSGNGTKLPFNVPGVNGTIPTYNYTVNYRYLDRSDNTYKIGKTTQGSAKLWSNVTLNSADYTKANYAYATGAGVQQITANNMVFNVDYNPIPVTVIVNHYLTTYRTVDGATPEAVSTDVPITPDTYHTFMGDVFTNTHRLEYTLDVGRSNPDQNVTLNSALTTINLYYTTTTAEKTPVNYTAHYYTRTNSYTLNSSTNKYVLTPGTYSEMLPAATGSGYHGTPVTVPSNMPDGYTQDTQMGDQSFTFTLDKSTNPNPNVHNYYYQKTDDNRVPATLTVKHIYQNLTVNGTVDVATETEFSGVTAYEGETWTATLDYNAPTGIWGTTDALAKTIASGHNELVITYTQDVRVPVTVTVDHIYNTYTWAVGANGIGGWVPGGTETESETLAGTYYVGGSATATEKPKDGFAPASDNVKTIVGLSETNNKITLVYNKQIGEPDNASAQVVHRYETYRSYVDGAGIVRMNELDADATHDENGNSYTGHVGDWYIVAAKQTDKDSITYTDVTPSTSDYKLTLAGENAQYIITYKRYINDLGEKQPVTVKPIYVEYSREIDASGNEIVREVSRDAATTPSALGDRYVGQIISVTPSNYVKDGYTYDGKDAQNTPNFTLTVGNGSNVITIVYAKETDNRKPASVVIRNHYLFETFVIENNVRVAQPLASDTAGTAIPMFVGQNFSTVGKGTASGYQVDSKKTQPTDTITVAAGENYVDFYWYNWQDNTEPATIKVVHKYQVIDANPIASLNQSKVWDVESQIPGEHYATQTYVATPDFQGGVFDADNITGVTPNGATDPKTGVKLVKGENVITITYVEHIDTSVHTSILVKHVYVRIDNSKPESERRTVEQITESTVNSQVGATFAAELQKTRTIGESTLTYDFEGAVYRMTGSADANVAAAGENTLSAVIVTENADKSITITYTRVQNSTTYSIIHTYYRNGVLVYTSLPQMVRGEVGSLVTPAMLTKVPVYNGLTYAFSGASPEALELGANAEGNTITLRYDYTYYAPDPDPDPPVNPPVNPPVTPPVEPPVTPPTEEIPEPEVPLTPGETIDDTEVPLGNLPNTGIVAAQAANPGMSLGLIALGASLAASALPFVFGRKKEDQLPD